MPDKLDPPGHGTADGRRDRDSNPPKPRPAQRKPKPKPPAQAKPDFVPVKLLYVPDYEPWHGAPALLIEVVRNLPLNVTVEELYVTFVMRGDDNLPGYYGDFSFRRRQNPDEPALNAARFTRPARMVGMTLPEGPGGPAAPSRKQKVWVDTQWKGSDNNMRERQYFFLPLA